MNSLLSPPLGYLLILNCGYIFEPVFSGIGRLLAFKGVAPVARRVEIDGAALMGDGDGAVAGIVRTMDQRPITQ